MDLLDYFRGRYTARKVLTFIDQLPSHSHYKQEIQQDDELVHQLFDESDDEGLPQESRPPGTEWRTTERLLAGLTDAVRQLNNDLLAVNGRKPHSFKPVPGPEFAYERLRKRADQFDLDQLAAAIDRSPSRRASKN